MCLYGYRCYLVANIVELVQREVQHFDDKRVYFDSYSINQTKYKFCISTHYDIQTGLKEEAGDK